MARAATSENARAAAEPSAADPSAADPSASDPSASDPSASDPSAVDRLDADVLADIARLQLALGRSSRLLRESASGGLTPTQLAVLGALLRDGPRQLTELAAAEHINPTLLSRVVGRLEEGGFVVRSAQEQDRRAYLVSITDQGAALIAALRHERCGELADVVGRLDPAHAASLMAALPALEALTEQLMLHRKD